jgi:hypothetical protein
MRISTHFVISIIVAHTKRVEPSYGEFKTTSSRLHGRFALVSSTLFSDTLLAIIEAYTRVLLPFLQRGQESSP